MNEFYGVYRYVLIKLYKLSILMLKCLNLMLMLDYSKISFWLLQGGIIDGGIDACY